MIERSMNCMYQCKLGVFSGRRTYIVRSELSSFTTLILNSLNVLQETTINIRRPKRGPDKLRSRVRKYNTVNSIEINISTNGWIHTCVYVSVYICIKETSLYVVRDDRPDKCTTVKTDLYDKDTESRINLRTVEYPESNLQWRTERYRGLHLNTYSLKRRVIVTVVLPYFIYSVNNSQ